MRRGTIARTSRFPHAAGGTRPPGLRHSQAWAAAGSRTRARGRKSRPTSAPPRPVARKRSCPGRSARSGVSGVPGRSERSKHSAHSARFTCSGCFACSSCSMRSSRFTRFTVSRVPAVSRMSHRRASRSARHEKNHRRRNGLHRGRSGRPPIEPAGACARDGGTPGQWDSSGTLGRRENGTAGQRSDETVGQRHGGSRPRHRAAEAMRAGQIPNIPRSPNAKRPPDAGK